MKTIQKNKKFHAPPDVVFDCLDDLGVTGMHMTKSSMPMMGGEMHLEFLSLHKTGLHTKYRWTGKALWWILDFTVEVTKWIKGKEKTWQTIGPTRIILYSWFQMNLKIETNSAETIARLSISYEKPKGIFSQILCFLLGSFYARWCLKNMLNDTEKKLTLLSSQSVLGM
jgi:hypothetical protein